MKLKSKLVVGNMLAVILTLGSFALSQWLINSHYNAKVLEENGQHMAQRFIGYAKSQAEQTMSYLTEALLNPMYFYDLDGIERILEPTLQNASTLEVKVYDFNGTVIHRGSREGDAYGMPLNDTNVEQTTLGKQMEYLHHEGNRLIIARPLILNQELLGGVMMVYSLTAIQRDIAENQAIIQQINQASTEHSTFLIVVVTAVMCLVSFVISIVMANTLIKPITKLVRHSQRISRGHYQNLNNIERGDELGELAKAFNEMDNNLKERSDAIQFLAYNDPLTKLPNRTKFLGFLEGLLEQHRVKPLTFAILFLDLDEFKRINDNLGHQAGDELLCSVASKISENLRHSDFVANLLSRHAKENSLIARVGGDEFLLCIPHIDQHAAGDIAQRLVHLFEEPILLKGVNESVVVGASVGIALFPANGQSAEELVKNADIAMYAAKTQGKGRYCHFTAEMEYQVLNRGVIERELRAAIIDFSQFEIHYQPKVNMQTGRVIGVEALIRWNHPARGLIAPSEFIPVAESTGLILPLGQWIMEEVCLALNKWHQLPHTDDFHVAINLSAKQIYNQDIAARLAELVDKHQLHASHLHVEVTETALMLEMDKAKTTLDKIRQLGIEVWLDDFGTGYASLAYLREFNVDGLKIDRSFVSDIEEDENDRALCSAVISMAQQMNIKVVAEGIETALQARYLLSEQCELGQGYLYSKPVYAEAISRILYQQAEEMSAGKSDTLSVAPPTLRDHG